MQMSANGREDWATQNIGLTTDVKRRLLAARAYPKEPAWVIVKRLLDEHEGKALPEA
jgi:hypothetical protein